MKDERPTAKDTCEFKITGFNLDMLNALCKYAMMLDHVTHAEPDEQLNVDGVINTILNKGLKREIKDIIKRHGFMDIEDFIISMSGCEDGAEVAHVVRQRENSRISIEHARILSQIPVEDKQCKLPL